MSTKCPGTYSRQTPTGQPSGGSRWLFVTLSKDQQDQSHRRLFTLPDVEKLHQKLMPKKLTAQRKIAKALN